MPELLVEGPGTEDATPGSPGALVITRVTATTSRKNQISLSLHHLRPA